ncbi:MAG: TRAP transporter substrate-binding protein [Sulfolobales archaeon]
MSTKPLTPIIAVLIVLVVIAGIGGYFAGSSAAPQPVTVTVGTGGLVTQTVTALQTITAFQTVTVQPTPPPTQVIELHTATHMPPNPCTLNEWGECNDHNMIHKIFKTLVEGWTGGRVKVIIHTAAELGAERDNVEHVRTGTIFMTTTSVSVLSAYTKKLLFFDTPGLFQNLEEYWAFAQSDVCAKRLQEAAAEIGNVIILGPSYYGQRWFATVKKPINSIEDIKGIKVRVIQSPIVVDAATALGFIAVPMPYTEIATALQTGTIEGHDQDLTGYMASRWYEIERYLAVFPWMIGTHVILINKQQFEALPADIQSAILTALKVAMQIKNTWDVLYEQIALDKLKKLMLAVTFPDPAPFLKIYEQFIESKKSDIGEDVINWLKNFRASK